MAAIGDLINALIAEWEAADGTTVGEINGGLCEEFAHTIIDRLGDAEASVMATPADGMLPGHCWIYLRGKHYDAEAYGGVDRFVDLPIFEDHRERGGELDAWALEHARLLGETTDPSPGLLAAIGRQNRR